MGTRSIAIPLPPCSSFQRPVSRFFLPSCSKNIFQDRWKNDGSSASKFRVYVRNRTLGERRAAPLFLMQPFHAGVGCLSVPSHYSSRCSQCLAHDLGNRSCWHTSPLFKRRLNLTRGSALRKSFASVGARCARGSRRWGG